LQEGGYYEKQVDLAAVHFLQQFISIRIHFIIVSLTENQKIPVVALQMEKSADEKKQKKIKEKERELRQVYNDFAEFLVLLNHSSDFFFFFSTMLLHYFKRLLTD
jgi:hypothetical protein